MTRSKKAVDNLVIRAFLNIDWTEPLLNVPDNVLTIIPTKWGHKHALLWNYACPSCFQTVFADPSPLPAFPAFRPPNQLDIPLTRATVLSDTTGQLEQQNVLLVVFTVSAVLSHEQENLYVGRAGDEINMSGFLTMPIKILQTREFYN